MSEWRSFLAYLPLDKANWDFKSSPNQVFPLLLYYSGFLKATPQSHHCLLVTLLQERKAVSGKNSTIPMPDRLEPKATHDFSLIYQSVTERPVRELLFRFQIAETDITAKQLTYLLVETLQLTTVEHKSYVLDRERGRFWAGLAANKLYQLRTNHQVWVDEQPL
ncbi:MAG: hypothetical protein ACRC6M_15960 [Microcystaceae cyanobacterium]